MVILAIGIEHALDVTVKRPHYADPREHRWAARLSHQNQSFHRCLPFWGFVLGLWKFHDVVAGIFERDEGSSALQLYRIIERTFPTAISHLPRSTYSAHSAGTKNRFASANHNLHIKAIKRVRGARLSLIQYRPGRHGGVSNAGHR
jgi:hypothetical protein